jgi:hypothetical protein
MAESPTILPGPGSLVGKCLGAMEKVNQIKTNRMGGRTVPLTIEVEQEVDGRWLAEVPALSGVQT